MILFLHLEFSRVNSSFTTVYFGHFPKCFKTIKKTFYPGLNNCYLQETCMIISLSCAGSSFHPSVSFSLKVASTCSFFFFHSYIYIMYFVPFRWYSLSFMPIRGISSNDPWSFSPSVVLTSRPLWICQCLGVCCFSLPISNDSFALLGLSLLWSFPPWERLP